MSIDPREPVPLSKAVRIWFPHGGVTVSTLRGEIYKGRLEVERIGGKIFVTGEAIEAMRNRCRDQPKVPISGSKPMTAEKSTGSSAMDQLSAEQAAVRTTAQALRKRLRNFFFFFIGPT